MAFVVADVRLVWPIHVTALNVEAPESGSAGACLHDQGRDRLCRDMTDRVLAAGLAADVDVEPYRA